MHVQMKTLHCILVKSWLMPPHGMEPCLLWMDHHIIAKDTEIMTSPKKDIWFRLKLALIKNLLYKRWYATLTCRMLLLMVPWSFLKNDRITWVLCCYKTLKDCIKVIKNWRHTKDCTNVNEERRTKWYWKHQEILV